MIQIVLVFLVVVVLLGMGGKWLRRVPRAKRRPALEAAARCPTCRSYVVGKAPAPCARADCPFR